MKPSARPSIYLVSESYTVVQVVRPGARYAVVLEGDELRGVWVPTGEACPPRHKDRFTQTEGMLLLPLLRARHAGGRPPAPATTPDGRLIDRVCRRLEISAEQLAAHLEVHESVLSKARVGEPRLTSKTRAGLHALLDAARDALTDEARRGR